MIQVWCNYFMDKELDNFRKAVLDKNIMEGPVLYQFQKLMEQILGVRHAIGTSSGSAALALALMGAGVQPGDEVIVPDLTFIATANAACLLGAKVIVAETQKGSTLLDFGKIEKYVTDKTKAIITVDLNGRISCSKELKERYSKKGICIIDDACQALMSGDKYGKAGTQSDIGCFSFGITKTVSTGMGGLVVTDRDDLYERMRIMKIQGMESVFESDSYICPGFNFKLPDILAAIGLGQLERIDKKMQHMIEIDEMYRDGLSNAEGISFLEKKENEFHWMTDILCDDRDKVRAALEKNNIISRPLGAPLHTAPFLQSDGYYHSAAQIQKRILYLPSGPDQDLKNVEYVIQTLRNIMQQ